MASVAAEPYQMKAARQAPAGSNQILAVDGHARRPIGEMLLLAVLSSTLTSCGTSDSSDPAAINKPTASSDTSNEQSMTETDTVLTLADFKLMDELGRPMNVTAEGVVTLPNGEWGRIGHDGTVTDAAGKLRARLSDGLVVDPRNQAFAILAEDGSAKVDDVELRFDEGGKLVGGSSAITLTPANSPARRAAMLVVLVALLRPADSDKELTPKIDLNIRLRGD
jgi:hypothetical protein